MLIKYQDLTIKPPGNIPGLVLLTGQEPFMLDLAYRSIRHSWQMTRSDDLDEKIIDIDTPNHWSILISEAHSYSLFSQSMLLDVRYDKKSLDPHGKLFFEDYLKNDQKDCLVIVRAPNLAHKQLQFLIRDEQALVIQLKQPARQAIKRWIAQTLRDHRIPFDPLVPDLIEQYTCGNLLACSQAIEKITLLHGDDKLLSPSDVKQQLFDQSQYQLFELSDACLNGDSHLALLTLRYAAQQGVEPTLILWVITQEIRNLLQLKTFIKQNISFQTALSQLKIWPQRNKLYQTALKKHDEKRLKTLLNICQTMDSMIKTGQQEQLWRSFDLLVLSLATGKQVGPLE